jgi:cell wall-associated NlpC family hydrolase
VVRHGIRDNDVSAYVRLDGTTTPKGEYVNRVLKAGASLIATTALAATAFAATSVPAQSAPASTAPKCELNFKSYPNVSAGANGTTAVAAECLLSSAGYSVKIDGAFTAAEAAAAGRFKATKKLAGGTVVDKGAWTALLSRGSTPKLSKGKKGEAVLRFQRALTASGRSVAITGTFDTATVNRVKGIQRAKGWKQSGVAGSGNWRLLQTGQAASLKVLGPSPKKKASKKSKGKIALAYAKKQLGDRYRYGAAGPNAWDCSGLTMKAWRKAGKKLPHSAKGQFHKGKKVSRKNLKPGDLVFFYSGPSHVAIYAGNGKVIHASRPGKPVAYAKIKTMPYKGARRVG